MSTYPERRFAGGAVWNNAVVAIERQGMAQCAERRFAGIDVRCQTIYELVPAQHMDAVRALIEALLNDEQIQEGMCSGDLTRSLRALPSELREDQP